MTDQAPRPHVWTLTVAISALIISAASLWYSHKAYRLNREISRSVLDVKIDLLSDWAFDPRLQEDQKPLSTRFTLYNNGKSVIDGIGMWIFPIFCYESMNVDTKSGEHLQPCVVEKKYREVFAEDIGPSASREYRLDLDTREFATTVLSRKDFSRKLKGLSIRPKIHYLDAVHGTVRTYCLTMQANDRGVFRKGTLYPCSDSDLFNEENLIEEMKDDRSPHE